MNREKDLIGIVYMRVGVRGYENRDRAGVYVSRRCIRTPRDKRIVPSRLTPALASCIDFSAHALPPEPTQTPAAVGPSSSGLPCRLSSSWCWWAPSSSPSTRQAWWLLLALLPPSWPKFRLLTCKMPQQTSLQPRKSFWTSWTRRRRWLSGAMRWVKAAKALMYAAGSSATQRRRHAAVAVSDASVNPRHLASAKSALSISLSLVCATLLAATERSFCQLLPDGGNT